MDANLVLPGVVCSSCGGWSSTAKKPTACRACGTPYTPVDLERANLETLVSAIRVLSDGYALMQANLTQVQARCSSLIDVARAAKRMVDSGDAAGHLIDLATEVHKLRDVEKVPT